MDLELEPTFVSAETFTQGEFERFCEEKERQRDVHRFELLRGRIVMTPPCSAPHGSTTLRIATRLDAFVRARGLGKVFESSVGYQLPTGDTLQPDVSFVSNARWAAAGNREGMPRVVPDLVVEVLSPKTATRDRTEKLEVYRQAGVREYWLVDPRATRAGAEIFVLRDGALVLDQTLDGEGIIESRILAGLALPVRELVEP